MTALGLNRQESVHENKMLNSHLTFEQIIKIKIRKTDLTVVNEKNVGEWILLFQRQKESEKLNKNPDLAREQKKIDNYNNYDESHEKSPEGLSNWNTWKPKEE